MICARVAGKIILAGEYDVLHGGLALAATIREPYTLEVTLEEAPAGEPWTTIHSDLWDEPKFLPDGDVASIFYQDDPLCGAVMMARQLYFKQSDQQTPRHLRVSVKSGLDIRAGMGSSSALRLAVLAAAKSFSMGQWQLQEGIDSARWAWLLQKTAQAAASGYDVATQLMGGIVAFRAASHGASEIWPQKLVNLGSDAIEFCNQQIHVYTGGKGAPTTPQIRSVREWLRASPEQASRLSAVSADLCSAIIEQAGTIKAASHVRTFFKNAPGFPLHIDEKLSQLIGYDQQWSWKTTGAGGEDAILVFGSMEALTEPNRLLNQLGWRRLDAPFANRPLAIEIIDQSTATASGRVEASGVIRDVTHAQHI